MRYLDGEIDENGTWYSITTFITECDPYLGDMIDQAALVHLIKPIIAEIKRM